MPTSGSLYQFRWWVSVLYADLIETNKKYGDYNAVIIEDVGHYPMLEKPDEFNQSCVKC
jgi:pimeloyl-ACP methyl ester carboxylesterase